MKLFKLLSAAAAATMMLAAPIAATAQEAVILFIDEAKLIATSKAGQSISTQIKALIAEAEAEVNAEGKSVDAEGKKLQAAKDSLSKEDFAKRYQALVEKAQRVGQLGQIKKAEVAQSESKAMAELNQHLQPVVKTLLERKKATVLLERRAVVFSDEKMDITDEIVAALDKKVKKIKVEKIDLVAQAEAAQKAQAKAASKK